MGGRGKRSEDANDQVSIKRCVARTAIEDIRNESMQQRIKKKGMKGMEVGSGAVSEQNHIAKKECACCFHRSLPAYSEYVTCPICEWIDDPIQNANPDLAPRSNLISLREARKKWKMQQVRQGGAAIWP